MSFSPVLSAVTSSPLSDAERFLNHLWRTQEHYRFIGIRDTTTGQFKNVPVAGSAEAVAFAPAFNAIGNDVYFSCSIFSTAASRKAENVAGAFCFFADFDVSPDKARSGKGYGSVDDAQEAVQDFCATSGLPQPNLIVASGSGLHIYWVVDSFAARDHWQGIASRLKGLMAALGLHADPSRTADCASVLRLPGTRNHKYSPPRNVELLLEPREYIPLSEWADAVDAAALKFLPGPSTCGSLDTETATPPPANLSNDLPFVEPPNLVRLASALTVLEADCDERTWTFHRIAPMAYTARAIPELHDQLYGLARRWSSGALCGAPSKKWRTPGCNGLTGEQYFERLWKRFLTDTYAGKRVTVGTIYFHAKAEGWEYSESNSVSHVDDDFGAA